MLAGHLRVNHTATGGHPLGATVADNTLVAHVVAMLQLTLSHIGHGFKTPVWVRRKPGSVIAGLVRTDFIQHQEGVHDAVIAQWNHPFDFDPRAVGGGAGRYAMYDSGHGVTLSFFFDQFANS